MTFSFDTNGLSGNSYKELSYDALDFNKKMASAGIATGTAPFQDNRFGFGTADFDNTANQQKAYVELAVPSYWNGLMG